MHDLLYAELSVCRTPAVSRADSRSDAGAEAGGVGFRVEPAVTQPAPPQTRTCAMNASGSSVTRVSAPLWRITLLPCKRGQMAWMILGIGSGNAFRSFSTVSHEMALC